MTSVRTHGVVTNGHQEANPCISNAKSLYICDHLSVCLFVSNCAINTTNKQILYKNIANNASSHIQTITRLLSPVQ